MAEARRELPTPVVRLGRHLEQRTPEAEAASRRQVLDGEVERQEEVVAEDRERLPVRDHLGDVDLHHRELRRAIGLLAASPGVAGDAGVGPEIDPRRRLPDLVGSPPHEERHPAGIPRCRGQRAELLLELAERQVARRVARGAELRIVRRHPPIRYRPRRRQVKRARRGGRR